MQVANGGWIVAGLIAVFALLQTLRLIWERGAPARRLARARERGRAGEHAARGLVERAGYRIDVVQPELEWSVVCDGEPQTVALRADLLVSRHGRSFVAEVKTGSAARLGTPSTRRQLLEYAVAYDVDGVLLVDMAEQRIHELRFPLRTATTTPRWAFALLLMAAVWALLRFS